MVVNIVAIAGLCIIATIMCKVIDKYNKEQAIFIAIITCTIILSFIAVRIAPLVTTINDLFSRSGMDTSFAQIVFKAIGICYLAEFATEICRDCNENSIAMVVQLTGKIALLLLAMPLFKNLIDIVMKFMA